MKGACWSVVLLAAQMCHAVRLGDSQQSLLKATQNALLDVSLNATENVAAEQNLSTTGGQQSIQKAVQKAMLRHSSSSSSSYLPWCSKAFRNSYQDGKESHYYVQELFFVPQFCQNARIGGKIVPDGYQKCGDSLYRSESKVNVIHGLWPSWRYKRIQVDTNGQECMQYSPQSCTNAEPFNLEKLKASSIFKELDLDWDAIHTHDANFWKYEWDKHGTCSGMGLVQYFSEALRAYDQIPSLTNIFRASMDSHGKIPVDEAKLRALLGPTNVAIRCHYTKESDGSKKYWFDKLQVCFSRNMDGTVGNRAHCSGKLSTCYGPIYVDGIN